MTGVPVARTYLPLTAADVAVLAETREVPAGAIVGIAVAPGTDEAGEYAAWLAAAALARSRGAAAALRVIASTDLDLALLAPAPGAAPTPVRIEGSLALRRFVAFHVDETVGGAESDLLWYDVTELAELLALLRTP